MKKILLALSIATLGSQYVMASDTFASEAKGFADKALEVVPRAILGATSYLGGCIEKHPGKSLIVLGALGIAFYEKHKTLQNQVTNLEAIARTPHTATDQANREATIRNTVDTQYRLTLTLSPLAWLESIVNTFVNFRANR